MVLMKKTKNAQTEEYLGVTVASLKMSNKHHSQNYYVKCFKTSVVSIRLLQARQMLVKSEKAKLSTSMTTKSRIKMLTQRLKESIL